MTFFETVRASVRGLALIWLAGSAGTAPAGAPPIEEITVVAQKREQSLLDVPVALSALSGEHLVDAGVRDLFDVADLVPSLDVIQNTGPINTGFRIRRIGNEPNIATFEPAVGLFVDGAVRTRSGVGMGSLFDIERIEVLRGPQSTLYGKNTTAGVIHVITRKPTREFEWSGAVTVGAFEAHDNAGLAELDAAVSGPISSRLSARLSGSFYAHDDLTANLLNGDDTDDMSRYAVRAQLSYAPAPALETRLILSRLDIDSAHAGDLDMDPGIAIAALNSAFGVPCPSRVTGDRALCRNRAGLADLETNDATLDVRYRGEDLALTSISNFQDYAWRRDFDADQLNIDLIDLTDRQDGKSFSQEFRLSAPVSADGLDWIAGIYYQKDQLVQGARSAPAFVLGSAAPLVPLPIGIPFGQPGNSGFRYAESESRHASVFASVDWRLTDRLSLTTGARWLTERKQSTIENSADHLTPTAITLLLLPAHANADLARESDGIAWNLIARYLPSERFMTYASVSRGFKPGGFNTRTGTISAASREFGDERVVSYEAGLKALLAGGGLRLNAAVFRSEYEDFQSAGFVGLRFLVNNAESVRIEGFEADLAASLSDRVSGGLALSFVDARYDEYTGGACHYGGAADNADASGCVLSGSRLPLAPRWISSSYVRYEQPLSSGIGFARLDWQWTSAYYTHQTLDPRHDQGAYNLWNFRAGWRRGHYELTAWVRNAGDSTYVMQAGPSNLFGNDPAYGAFLGAPRSYGLTYRVRW